MVDGVVITEDLEMVEAWMNTEKEKAWKIKCHTTRCTNVSQFICIIGVEG